MNKLMIQMEGIVKRFGSITALDNMNFHAYGGEITAIVGDNGSGKSTLIQIPVSYTHLLTKSFTA